MAVQLSVAARNARLDQIEATGGAGVLLRIYTGAQPADCATAASGTKLVEIACPADWMANAASGSKAKSGAWSAAATASGAAGYFRI